MLCNHCQVEIPANSKFCFKCGAKIKIACAKCGEPLVEGAKFCSECGFAVVSMPLDYEEAGYEAFNFFSAKGMGQPIYHERFDFVKKGSQYYFRDGDSVYKYNREANSFQLLYTAPGLHGKMNVVGDWIYLLNNNGIFKAKCDGSLQTEIVMDISSEDAVFYESLLVLGMSGYSVSTAELMDGEHCYHESVFYKIDLNGKTRKPIFTTRSDLNIAYGYRQEILLVDHETYYLFNTSTGEIKKPQALVGMDLDGVLLNDIGIDLYNSCVYVKDEQKGILKCSFGSNLSEKVFESPLNYKYDAFYNALENAGITKPRNKFTFNGLHFNGKQVFANVFKAGNSALLAKVNEDGHVTYLGNKGCGYGGHIRLYEDCALMCVLSWSDVAFFLVDLETDEVVRLHNWK